MPLTKLLIKQWPRISQILNWLLLISLSWQLRHTILWTHYRGEFFEYASISIYLTDILIVVLLLGWLLFGKNKINWGPKIIIWPLTSFLVWVWLSLIAAYYSTGDLVSAVSGAIHLTLFYFWYLYLINHIKTWKELLIPFGIGVGLQVILGVLQYFNNHSMGWAFMGEQILDPIKIGIPVVIVDSIRQLRSHGAMSHANVFGGLVAVSLPILLAGVWGIKDKIVSWLGTFGVALVALALLFSFSRGAWLVAGFSLLILTILSIWKLGLRNLVQLIALVLFGIIISSTFWPAITSRFNTAEGIERNSVVERFNQFEEWEKVSREYPLTGAGIGQYTIYLVQQGETEIGWRYDSNLPGWVYNFGSQVWDYQPVHNIWLLILAELGWIGVGLFILLWLGVIAMVIRGMIKNPTFLSFGVGLSVLSLIVIGMFDHYLWTLQQGKLVLFLSLGGAVIINEFLSKNEHERRES
ncbi:MAG: O-antigen ligase family protein [Patescibacteria group bacterium]|nr:O-antigen ligase family protein [Patescibacteria group bacterium]